MRAKTGTLDDCTALAGSFAGDDGKDVFFAIIVNARGMNRPDVVQHINRIVREAAGLSTRRR